MYIHFFLHLQTLCSYQLYPRPLTTQVIVGIYRILCPRRSGTYPGLMQGNISIKRAGNLLHRVVNICQYSDQRRPGSWGRETDLPMDLQEKCPPQSRAITRTVPWTSQSTKLNPWASPHYHRVVGARVTIDSRITEIAQVCTRIFCYKLKHVQLRQPIDPDLSKFSESD